MDQTPSFTFAKEHPTRRSLLGKMDGVLGFSITLILLVGLTWIGSGLASSMFVSNKELTQETIKKEETSWDRKLERSILSVPVRVQKMKDLATSHVYGSWLFDFLRANMLNGVSILTTETKLKGQSITLQAVASDFNTLARQIVWLRSQSAITNLILSAVRRSDDGKVKFTLALELSPSVFTQTPKSR